MPPGVQPQPEAREAVPSLAAFENYIKGLLAESAAAQVGFLEKAIALQPDYEQGHLALWRVLTEADDHERALAAALAVPGDSRRARRARFAAAASEIALRRHDDAFARLRTLGDEQPAAEIFNNMGVIQLRRGATPETGRATYWSRSRKKLWKKGEESGNVQMVKALMIDCDLDTIVLKIEQIGGAACHTGHRSCFYRERDGGTWKTVGKPLFDPAAVYKK